MPGVRINNIETLDKLKAFRDKLSKILGVKLTLEETIAWMLRYGPAPEDYFPKPASELLRKKRT